MVKKSSENARNSVHRASDFAGNSKSRLDIKQIRSFAKKLLELPDGAPMPGWPELTIGDRLSIVAQLIPEAQRDEVMGVKSSFALPRYRSGTDIPITLVAALAAETEIPLTWIVTGKPMMRRPEHLESEEVLGFNEEPAPLAGIGAEDVAIQKLAFKVAAGRGALILDEAADHIRFPRAILQHVGVQPQHARLMEAAGESMRATINDGDLMLVDVSPSATQIVEGKIYVFSIGDEAFVKRLRRTGKGVVMISDNREMFPPEEVPGEAAFKIFGRVMWAGRSL